MKIKNSKDLYNHYLKLYPDSDVTYDLFRYVVSTFNKKLVNKILEGETFNPGHNIGDIRIKRCKRNFNKPKVDFGSTRKLKAQGINKVVYFTDDYWYRWYWKKSSCKIRNKSVYKFEPTNGKGGNKKRLSRLLKENDFSHNLFDD